MKRRTPATILLLAEPDEVRVEYAEALRNAGLRVVETSDSRAALESMNATRPTVIVADLNSRLRDDRLSLCREIKDNPSTKSIPVLLTTAGMKDDDAALATDPGVLVLTLAQHDGAKLLAALNGVLAAQRAEPARASLRRRKNVSRSA